MIASSIALRQVRLIVGLGNPGPEHVGTPHNVGRETVQGLAGKLGVSFFYQHRFEGQVAEASIGGRKMLLLLPKTGMNNSGRSVKAFSQHVKIWPQETLVVVDDITFKLGHAQINLNGGAGGHNGLKSVQEHLATKNYMRLRVGIGEPQGSCREHVLGKFSEEEYTSIPFDALVDALEKLCIDDFAEAARQFNARFKNRIQELDSRCKDLSYERRTTTTAL